MYLPYIQTLPSVGCLGNFEISTRFILNPTEFQSLLFPCGELSILSLYRSFSEISKHFQFKEKCFSCLIVSLLFASSAARQERHLRIFTFSNCFWESSSSKAIETQTEIVKDFFRLIFFISLKCHMCKKVRRRREKAMARSQPAECRRRTSTCSTMFCLIYFLISLQQKSIWANFRHADEAKLSKSFEKFFFRE